MKSEARQITGSTSAGEGVDSIVMVASINAFPYVEVRCHKSAAGGDANEVLSSDLIGELAKYQKSMFEGNAKPDVQVSLTDGKGGTLDWLGFSSAPGVAVGQGAVGLTVNSVHPDAMVDALKLDIYASVGFSTEYNDIGANTSIADRIRILSKRVIEDWQANPLDDSSAGAKVRAQIDTVNTKFLPQWYKILGASTDTTQMRGLENLYTAASCIDIAINKLIVETLMASRMNFMGTIGALSTMFQMFYAPDLTSKSTGRLVMMKDIVDNAEAKSVVITGSGVRFQLGARAAAPTGQVLVMGLGGPYTDYAAEIAQEGSPEVVANVFAEVLVTYPSLPAGGRSTVSVPLPAWLPDILNEPLDHPAIVGPGNVKVIPVVTQLTDYLTLVTAIKDGALTKLCADYAKNIFIDLSIGSCSVSLSSDLDLSWELGKFYKVSSQGGGLLFTGLLSALTHQAVSLQGAASASTQLSFSHVTANGFTLPSS